MRVIQADLLSTGEGSRLVRVILADLLITGEG